MGTYIVLSKKTNRVVCRMKATRMSFSKDFTALYNGDDEVCKFSNHIFYVTEAYK